MLKKFALPCLAALGAALFATPAGAAIASPDAGTYVVVSASYRNVAAGVCPFDMPYQQVMRIVPAGMQEQDLEDQWVCTEFVYSTGRKAATVTSTTTFNGETFYIYELGTCAC